MNKKIEFVSLVTFNNEPESAIKHLPSWYKKAKKYSNNFSTFKNCVPFFDGMYSGYVIVTPCDIEFYEENEKPNFKIDKEFDGFVTLRSPMNEFLVPDGFHEHHFAWTPQWGVRTPSGYSCIYINPMNNFSLPFVSTSGIINNDKVFQPGSIPFFIRKGFNGIIPKGTPIIQIIPFKRNNWKSKKVLISSEDIEHFKPGSKRIENNYYRNNLWEKNNYE